MSDHPLTFHPSADGQGWLIEATEAPWQALAEFIETDLQHSLALTEQAIAHLEHSDRLQSPFIGNAHELRVIDEQVWLENQLIDDSEPVILAKADVLQALSRWQQALQQLKSASENPTR